MTRGIISFVFDDGYSEIMSDALPLLEKYKIKATIAVPIETEKVAKTENSNVSSLSSWKEYCFKKGHELGAHGKNHSPLSTLSEEQIRQDLSESKTATNASSLIYPGGAFDPRVKRIATEYFSSARTTKRGFETFPPKDKYELCTFNATQKNFAPWKWNFWALRAMVENKWLIETFHHVNHPDKIHSVQLTELEAHIKFINQLPIRIATIGQVISENKVAQ
jgi:peptidoglycan/xylan/chitin deacetylase (PgdA/CDA1 family)